MRKIECVPLCNSGEKLDEVECSALLIFGGAICEPALPIGVDGISKGKPGLSLIQPNLAGLAQLALIQPVACEQCSLDATKFARHQIELVQPTSGGSPDQILLISPGCNDLIPASATATRHFSLTPKCRFA